MVNWLEAFLVLAFLPQFVSYDMDVFCCQAECVALANLTKQSKIRWALHREARLVQNMGVDHSGGV
jgi:hypothetical protein